MDDYQQAFIEFALQRGALKFGEFELKSGRVSPYFFNAGMFNRASDLAELGRFYAKAIAVSGLDFDLLFGPAYKGIPIATATAVALFDHYQNDCNVVFNRKEVKKHGEGGSLVGASLEGKVVIIDDVITAGTAIREVIDIIEDSEAELAAVLIALDRQEKGKNELSAIQEISNQYNIPVVSIVQFDQLIGFVKNTSEFSQYLPKIEKYQQQYGV